MSIGGDGYGERDRTGEDGPAYGRGTGPLTTRTRLPESEGGGGRPPSKPGRSVVTVLGVVVLLIAAIAFANRGGGSSSDEDRADSDKSGGQAQPTAPTGQQPVTGSSNGIAKDFPHTKQGAQSAAANYTVALGSDGMFNKQERHDIVQSVGDKQSVDKLQADFDSDYNARLNKKIGIDKNGAAKSGSTFVNRTIPAGTSVKSYSDGNAKVAVWCAGLFGIAGEHSTKPVSNNWFTVTLELNHTDGDWKVVSSSQKDGPTPVNGDNTASGADEIGKAAKEYGGFTYAR